MQADLSSILTRYLYLRYWQDYIDVKYEPWERTQVMLCDLARIPDELTSAKHEGLFGNIGSFQLQPDLWKRNPVFSQKLYYWVPKGWPRNKTMCQNKRPITHSEELREMGHVHKSSTLIWRTLKNVQYVILKITCPTEMKKLVGRLGRWPYLNQICEIYQTSQGRQYNQVAPLHVKTW